MSVVVAARDQARLVEVARATGAMARPTDGTDATSVEGLFSEVERRLDAPSLVVYNASRRLRGPAASLDPAEVQKVMQVTAFGGFLVAQAAVRRMLPRGRGTIIFTGASASVKGYAESAPFAMGKFALRGLAQSLARELGPKGIHVAHVIVDGAIRRGAPAIGDDTLIDPDAIAAAYLHIHNQPKSAWVHELDLRPAGERF
jgi:NAD(P)-dependent dehydrogenase (short-subunit alcohol dehydrogenase family)